MQFRVVSYNIHRGKGLDGRRRLDRIRDVLGEVDADVVGLQEVLGPQARELAETTGLHPVFGPTCAMHGEDYGNLVLSRFPVVGQHSLDLSCQPFEPRGGIRVDLDVGGGRLSVLNVHLGLHYLERVRQARLLADPGWQEENADGLVILGDFNEWFPGRASRLLRRKFGRPVGRAWRRTHPSPLPMFALDRIYHAGAVRLTRVGVHRSSRARIASDHLPTFADLVFDLSLRAASSA
jgi:endonuclease/exonuclease/phosphatase family metal-dependent hydrolase